MRAERWRGRRERTGRRITVRVPPRDAVTGGLDVLAGPDRGRHTDILVRTVPRTREARVVPPSVGDPAAHAGPTRRQAGGSARHIAPRQTGGSIS